MEVCFHQKVTSIPEPFREECLCCLPRSNCVKKEFTPIKLVEITQKCQGDNNTDSVVFAAKAEIYQRLALGGDAFFVISNGQKVIKYTNKSMNAPFIVCAGWTYNLQKLAVAASDGSILIVNSKKDWNERIKSTLQKWTPPLCNKVPFSNPALLQQTMCVIGEAVSDVKKHLGGVADSERLKKVEEIAKKERADHLQEMERLKQIHSEELERMREQNQYVLKLYNELRKVRKIEHLRYVEEKQQSARDLSKQIRNAKLYMKDINHETERTRFELSFSNEKPYDQLRQTEELYSQIRRTVVDDDIERVIQNRMDVQTLQAQLECAREKTGKLMQGLISVEDIFNKFEKSQQNFERSQRLGKYESMHRIDYNALTDVVGANLSALNELYPESDEIMDLIFENNYFDDEEHVEEIELAINNMKNGKMVESREISDYPCPKSMAYYKYYTSDINFIRHEEAKKRIEEKKGKEESSDSRDVPSTSNSSNCRNEDNTLSSSIFHQIAFGSAFYEFKTRDPSQSRRWFQPSSHTGTPTRDEDVNRVCTAKPHAPESR